MSTLQISLAIIGVVLLTLIVAYNAWTARRNAPKKARSPADLERDSEQALRHEPAFDGDSAHSVAPPPDSIHSQYDIDAGLISQGLDVGDPLDLPTIARARRRRLGLDPLIDAIAPLQADQQVSGDAALAALPPTRRAGSKPFSIEGFNEAEQEWQRPVAGQRYRQFQAGVQLANRTGALNEIEFSEFVMKTQAFADAINAAPDFPDMLHEVARARELDQFASEHDAQLAFVLRARRAAWSPGYLQQNAARMGFIAGALPGRMVLPASAPGLPPLLNLVFDGQATTAEDVDQSAIRDLLISLDVAQVHRSEKPFARLREIAVVLCTHMDGVLCDQHGTPLPAMAMEPIATDLELLYDKLDSRDLAAGSPLARRLFS
jgi:hypothetical protein